MQLNYKIKRVFIFLTLWLSCSSTALANTFSVFTGQINAQKINVRLDATVSAEIICVLAKGELVEVAGEAYDWYKIRLPATAPAYIKKNLLECNKVDPDFASPLAKCLSAKVIKDKVNIRLKPTEGAGILGIVDKAMVVEIVADEGDWYKIHPVYQSYGWVNKKFVNQEVVVIEKQKIADTVKLPDQLVLTGKVAPYGIVLWRQATHKLVTTENKIYLLKGDRKSLDNLNYRQVKVTGKLISLPQSKHPIIQIDILEALN